MDYDTMVLIAAGAGVVIAGGTALTVGLLKLGNNSISLDEDQMRKLSSLEDALFQERDTMKEAAHLVATERYQRVCHALSMLHESRYQEMGFIKYDNLKAAQDVARDYKLGHFSD